MVRMDGVGWAGLIIPRSGPNKILMTIVFYLTILILKKLSSFSHMKLKFYLQFLSNEITLKIR